MASENNIGISSRQFVTILKKFDKDGDGDIKLSELDAFLKAFVDEGLIENSRAVVIAEKIREEQQDGDEVSMTTLTKEIAPVNFLTAEFGEQKTRITSVDFMKLWNNYDADNSGYLDRVELQKFFYDIVTKNKGEGDSEDTEELERKVDHYIKTMFEMLNIQEDKVSLEKMCKFCPVEENFLEQYEDKSDEIEGCELEGFLKDLYDRKHKPGQSFEKFKEEKMKKFDKDKNKKFSKQEVKKILSKLS
ncbi:Calbindin-32 [Stylophora pistillata]|uniref:Calbindin-32 n=1 Tax=Stylophora pistillata TaxID=50429 RepID=A0A2B4SB98_STYPI|nr:Calbindin-32 [Stylophora pistillata]